MQQLRCVALLMLVAVGACAGAGTADYERHSMSRLRDAPDEAGGFVFEARTSARYPRDDAAAEAVRMRWLASWLRVRRACPGGHVVERADSADATLARMPYQLAYRVRCSGADSGSAEP